MPWFTLAGVTAAAVPLFWPEAHAAALYRRDAILAGEWWRLITGHFAHFGLAHAAWNCAVVLAAALWLERLAPRRARVFWLSAPPVLGLTLLVGAPALQTYAGLSGVATGLVALLALELWPRSRIDRGFAAALAGLLVLKLAAECVPAEPLFVRFDDTSIRPVPLVHAAGTIWALICGWCGRAKKINSGATGPAAGP